jgi:hypothetical protein
MKITAENKAIEIFNTALKQCELFGMETNKENAKQISFSHIFFLKSSWVDIGLIDNLHLSNFKKSIDFFNRVKEIILNF